MRAFGELKWLQNMPAFFVCEPNVNMVLLIGLQCVIESHHTGGNDSLAQGHLRFARCPSDPLLHQARAPYGPSVSDQQQLLGQVPQQLLARGHRTRLQDGGSYLSKIIHSVNIRSA